MHCADKEISDYVLIDFQGKEVLIFSKQTGQRGIDITNLDSGIYVLLARDQNQTIKTQTKWVKH